MWAKRTRVKPNFEWRCNELYELGRQKSLSPLPTPRVAGGHIIAVCRHGEVSESFAM